MTGIQDTGPTAPEPFPGGADPTFAAASRDELGNFGTITSDYCSAGLSGKPRRESFRRSAP
jgi:hypothetical protein